MRYLQLSVHLKQSNKTQPNYANHNHYLQNLVESKISTFNHDCT